MLKKITTIFFILNLALFVSPTFSSEATSEQLVRVGYVTGKGLISDINSVDKKGYGYDLLKKIEQSSNLIFEFIPYTHQGALDALKNNEIDLYGPVVYSPSTYHEFTYLFTSIGKIQSILASKSSDTIFYNDLEKINNSTIAVYKANPFLEEFKEFLEKNNIQANFLETSQKSVSGKDADYYLISNMNDEFHNYKNALNTSSKHLYFIGNKNNSELNHKINDELLDILTHTNNFLERTYLTYYDNINLTKKHLTKEESDFLRDKHFTVGYTLDHQPIEFLNSKGKPDGISVQILDLLAEEYGFTVSYVGYNAKDSKNAKDFFDILISIQDDYSDIDLYYNQTEAYLRLPMVLMLNVPDQQYFNKEDPIKIGLYNYTTLDYTNIFDEFPNSELHRYNSLAEAFTGFLANEFEAGFFTITGAEHIQTILGGEQTKVIGTEISLPLRLFISKNLSNDYVSAFNGAIENLDESIVNEIVSKQTLAFQPIPDTVVLIKEYITYILTAIFLVIFSIFFFFYREQKKKRKEIQKVINTDSLTGLISLHRFRELMKERLDTAEANQYEVITLDIDYFRIINNIYGFEFGTKTIRAIAKILSENYNHSGAIISRVVGELFVILHKVDAEEDVEKICHAALVPAIKEVLGKDYSLSMSVGVYRINNLDKDVNAIIDRANIARLRGKKHHSLTFNAFDQEMKDIFEKQTDIRFRMEHALRDKEFKVFYQPKINYQTLEVVGAEALIRWFPSNRNPFYPDEFIPVFEANGFIKNLDFYVFEEVFEFIKKYSPTIKVPVISINLSGITLFDPQTPPKLLALMEKHNITPPEIEVEVTESAILDNNDHMSTHVDQLKKLGLTISMDDFGAGVSSLNRLSTMNIDIIKLDKAFLDYNSQISKGSIIVENIVRMAKDLKMKVVSEGVEKASQASWLKSIGCDLAQGYYFERPLDENTFVALLQSNKKYSI